MKQASEHTSAANEHASQDARLEAYLTGSMSAAEQRAFEEWLSDAGPESDALDGLLMLNQQQRAQSVQKLQAGLRQKLGRKKRRDKTPMRQVWIVASVLLVLLLVVLGYVVLRMLI